MLAAANAADPYTESLHFVEKFDSAGDGWKMSQVSDYVDGNEAIFFEPSLKPADGFESDIGLRLTMDAKKYGISKTFAKGAFDPKGRDTIIQYEVKLEETLLCGGAYLKLLRPGTAPESLDS